MRYSKRCCVHCHAVATFSKKARELIPAVKHYLATSGSTTPHVLRSQHVSEGPNEANFSYRETYEGADSVQESSNMSSVNGRQRETSHSDQTETPSRSVTNIKKEAEEEYEQLQRVEERLNQLAKTCVQSNLPHVIREMRATVENKLAEILSEAGTSDLAPTRNRLRTRQEALLELGHSPGNSAARPVHKGISTPTQRARPSSNSPSHTELKREPVDAKKKRSSEAAAPVEEHVLSRIAGFAAAVEASRRKRVILPTSVVQGDDVKDHDYLASKTEREVQRREKEPSSSTSDSSAVVQEDDVKDHVYLASKTDRQVQRREKEPSFSANDSSALQANCGVVEKHSPVPEASAFDQEEKKQRQRVLKRFYVRKGSHWVLTKVIVKPNASNSSTEDQLPSSSRHSRGIEKDRDADEIPSNQAPRIVKRVLVKASSAPRMNSSIADASISTTQADQERSEIKDIPKNIYTEPQKIVDHVMASSERSSYLTVGTKRRLVRMLPMQRSSKIARISEHIRKGVNITAITKSSESQTRSEPLCLMCGKSVPPSHDGDEITWLCCSNRSKCRARAHGQCLREARLKCFVCHVGSWTFTKECNEAVQNAVGKQGEEQASAFTEVNS